MTQKEKSFICELLSRLLPAYDDDGNTVEEYYNNIILPDLTISELDVLKKIAAGNIYLNKKGLGK